MKDILYLAWRYLAYYRFKTAVLVGSIALIVYLPLALNILVDRSTTELTARADSSPLLVGAKGSPLELVLSSLYFESDVPPTLRHAEVGRIRDSGLAMPIPLHTRFETSAGPIVGTSLDYFDFRNLEIRSGRKFGLLGECVLGAEAARQAGIAPGDSVLSTPESVFDIAGTYPLKMRVAGVLEPSGTPDDRAVFVDVKTAWVIEGLAHGHEDLNRPEARGSILRKDGSKIVANASVMQYSEITEDNVGTFHFHGDPADYPIHSIIVVPRGAKSAALLRGRYLGDEELVQIVRPRNVMEELLDTVLTVRQYVLVAAALLTVATFATMALVFLLSIQLRRREIETMSKIGGSGLRIASVLFAEIFTVILAGATLAAVLSLITSQFAASATRLLVQLSQ